MKPISSIFKHIFLLIACFHAALADTSKMSYSACQAYYKQATATIDSVRVYGIEYGGKPHLVAFSTTPLKSSKIIKKDSFIGLYLFEGKTPMSYRLKPLDSYAHTLPLAAINAQKAVPGKVLNFERGVFDLGKFSAPLPEGAVISTICYQIYGFSAHGQYFVPKILIDRFLSAKGGIYGDIGVRVSENTQAGANTNSANSVPRGVIVEQVDLFFPKNVFLPKDRILRINQEPINSMADFEWKVANLTPGKTAKVAIMRGNKILELQTQIDRRYGGGLLSDSFFERYGVVLDKNLVIKGIQKPLPYELSQLSVGDKFIWIDKTPVRSNDGFWHFRQLFSQAGVRGKVELLLLHEGVEIFVRSRLK
ncbi:MULTISPECIES: DUF7488 domain-containing protein [unclassified Helicobacter]|uniref:DUF7488 domain-containing protein n=1 Tax=unclassified Helicobacter TaxID=2593540 RepID=UPI0009ED7DB3|nr:MULTISPECIES: PDZ domain-containing protein [unclassified Helicobacter]